MRFRAHYTPGDQVVEFDSMYDATSVVETEARERIPEGATLTRVYRIVPTLGATLGIKDYRDTWVAEEED